MNKTKNICTKKRVVAQAYIPSPLVPQNNDNRSFNDPISRLRDQIEYNYQPNQTCQLNQTSQISQPNQINQINQINQMSQLDQVEQTSQIDQINKCIRYCDRKRKRQKY
jgi:hypothetical protein